jgi:hypothetical protein
MNNPNRIDQVSTSTNWLNIFDYSFTILDKSSRSAKSNSHPMCDAIVIEG